MNRLHKTLLAALSLSLSACSLAPSAVESDMARTIPTEYAIEHTADSSSLRWWAEFRDPMLEELIDSALTGNLDLSVAEARVREVQQLYRIARAAQLPSVNGSLDGSRQNTPTNTGATGRFSQSIPDFPNRFDITSYSASLGFAWELDFWGRARDGKRAAISEYVAGRADLQAARMGVISETISTYAQLAESAEQLRISRSNEELLRERADITEQRYDRGLVTSFELYRIRQSLEDAAAVVPQLEALHFQLKGRLAVLTGRYRTELDELFPDDALALTTPSAIPAGLPSTLLAERPDLIAAEARMEAARLRVGAARADRLPRLSLTAAGGTQSSDLSDLVQTGQRFGSLAGSVAAPIFNAGALRAASRAAETRYEAAVDSYDSAVLTAFTEVESAIVTFDREQTRHAALADAAEQAGASFRSQEDRYRRGVGDYVALLDAELNLLRTQGNLASGRRALALAKLAVHRALGGAWVAPIDA